MHGGASAGAALTGRSPADGAFPQPDAGTQRAAARLKIRRTESSYPLSGGGHARSGVCVGTSLQISGKVYVA